MDIKIICAGRMKEKCYKEACGEYEKMLSRFCRVSIEEVQDEPLSCVKSAAEEQIALKKEAERISGKLAGYVIVLDIRGKKMDSGTFAKTIDGVMSGGYSRITFVIGSSLGLHESVKQRADMLLSFSDMTMPHRLFRVVLLEQVYRAFKIINGETYHK